MTTTLRSLTYAARFTAVTVAHELRRDYERGVFSRGTLGAIGGTIAIALVTLGSGDWSLTVILVSLAAVFTYVPARADRRWRDDWRER